ncbi:hypothetical protein MUP01_08235 [Candidatus Bathyarchaeota archaeon]|nr:hypothetical protein [Candidatus Bathyarchaeota archaeon]
MASRIMDSWILKLRGVKPDVDMIRATGTVADTQSRIGSIMPIQNSSANGITAEIISQYIKADQWKTEAIQQLLRARTTFH